MSSEKEEIENMKLPSAVRKLQRNAVKFVYFRLPVRMIPALEFPFSLFVFVAFPSNFSSCSGTGKLEALKTRKPNPLVKLSCSISDEKNHFRST